MAAVEWRPGDVLADLYEVRGQLGDGGVGRVYRVHHLQWGLDLALKVPRSEAFAHALEGLIREAQVWVELPPHPNVVACHYLKAIEGRPGLFVECVDGGSLSSWIADGRLYAGGPEVALARILDCAIQFAWGLHHAHQHGLVHQDVKPGNALMSATGELKVTDFGLAQAYRHAAGAPVSGESSSGLTPAYASPEQMRGLALTPASDAWSWAVAVLRMFVGTPTWKQGPQAPAALTDFLERGPAAGRPSLPDALADVLRRCLVVDPLRRADDLAVLAGEMREHWPALVGGPHPRPVPGALTDPASLLNNRALTLLDLGRPADAEAAWVQALGADPCHVEASYNLGLRRWRRGEITDLDLVAMLETAPLEGSEGARSRLLLGLVHLERGDLETAEACLREAAEATPGDSEVAAALRALERGRGQAPPAPGPRVRGVVLRRSADGSTALVRAEVLPEGANPIEWRAGATQRLDVLRVERGEITRSIPAPGVSAVDLSHDGRLALLGTDDDTVELWSTETGERLRSFEGPLESVTSVALSADGSTAMAGSRLPWVFLWETQTGRAIGPLEGHERAVLSVALRADGTLGLSGSADGTLRLWDTATGRCQATLRGHDGEVRAVALSRDGVWGFSGGADGTLRRWHLSSGQIVTTMVGHRGAIESVVVSDDGGWAWSRAAHEGRLWDATRGRCLRTFEPGAQVELHGWPGRPLVAPHRHTRVRAISPRERVEREAADRLHRAGVQFARGATAVALELLREARALPGLERWPPGFEAWKLVARQGRRTGLRQAWRAETLLGHADRIESVALSEDGRRVASVDLSGSLRLWDADTATCLGTWPSPEPPQPAASAGARLATAISADGSRVLGAVRSISVWDAETGGLVQTLDGHAETVHGLALSRDGHFVLSGAGDRALRLWDADSGCCLRVFHGHSAAVSAVALSGDARLGVSASHDGDVRVWDLATGEALRRLTGHSLRVTDLRLSRDERHVLSTSWDGTLRLWDLASGACLRVMGDAVEQEEWDPAAGAAPVRVRGLASAALGPEGRWAVGLGLDGEIAVWDSTSGLRIGQLPGHRGSSGRIDLSADGWRVVSGDVDGAIAVWSLDWELEPSEACGPRT